MSVEIPFRSRDSNSVLGEFCFVSPERNVRLIGRDYERTTVYVINDDDSVNSNHRVVSRRHDTVMRTE